MKGIDRILAIIGQLDSVGVPCGVTEISKELRLSKSTVYRVLSSLQKAQWVSQNPETQKYSLGSEVLELGLHMLSRIDLRNASLPYLYQLRDVTGETAMLTLRTDLERMYIDQIPGMHEVRQIVELGKQYPLWCGAPAKSMLAYVDESEVEAVMDNLRRAGIQVFASGQLVDIDRLRAELVEIRRRGWVVSSGERVPMTTAVAAPIFDRYHRACGAISVAGPLPRFTIDLATRYGEMVSQAARDISLRLGDLGENAGVDR